MAAPLLRTLVAAVALLAIAEAYGQDRAQYAPVTPTLTERLGQVRDNLFGTGEPDGAADPRASNAQIVRTPRGDSAVNQRINANRPSQSAAPAARRALSARGYSGTAAMSGRATAGNPSDARTSPPDQAERDSLPALARRPAFGPTGNVNPGAHTGASISPLSSRRTLQERLAAAREPEQGSQAAAGAVPAGDVEPDAVTDEAANPFSSRRNSLFHAGPATNNVQHVINPTITGADGANDAASGTPPLARSPRPAVAGPVAPTAETTGDSSVVSSRRGFSAGSPSDRLASAMPARDRLPVADDSADRGLLFKRQSPLISIETAGPRTIVIGKEATYTVIVQNAGQVAAQDVAVTVRVPEWAEVVASKESSGVAHIPQAATSDANNAGAAAGMQEVQWSLPRLEASGKEQLSLQIVPRQSRPFDLAVQWSFTPITSTTVVQVQEPKLTMSLSGPAEVLFGDTKIFKMTLANPGTGDAENIVIHLSPLTGQPGVPTRHQIGTIRAGDSKVIEVELTARQSGKLVIHATATADGGLQAEVSEEVTIRRAALETKIVGGKVRYAGTVAAYQIEVLNSGNAPAENVQVVVALPSGTKLVAATSGGQASADGTKVHWSIPTIRAGGDAVVELKCQMNNPGANRLAVHTTAAGDVSASAEETTQVEALADLKLDVIEPKGPIAVGAEVTYEIRLNNRGTKSATDVKVVGYFSGKIDPVAATGGEHRLVPGIVIFKPIASLAAGNDATFKITARANAPGHHMFKAEVVCESSGAKLGSEHTTLFYGDKVAGDSIPGGSAPGGSFLGGSAAPGGGADEAQPALESPRPLAPKALFEPDDSGTAESAPALQSQAAPVLQRAAPARFGSVYAPSTPAAAPVLSGAGAMPVSPFALRPEAKK